MLPRFCTLDQWRQAFLLPAIGASAITLFMGIMLVGLIFGLKHLSTKSRLLFLGVVTAICAGCATYSIVANDHQRIFTDLVMSPSPAGVKDLRVRGYRMFGGEWACEFSADKATVQEIMNHLQFIVPAIEQEEEIIGLMKSAKRHELLPAWAEVSSSEYSAKVSYKKMATAGHGQVDVYLLVHNADTSRAWMFLKMPGM